MNQFTNNAAFPQGGNAAHLGRTGVEFFLSKISGKKLLVVLLFFVVMLAIIYCKGHNNAVEVSTEEEPSDHPESEVSESEVVVATLPVETEISVEDRIRQLRAEGKSYSAIAHELHVNIRVISGALKS